MCVWCESWDETGKPKRAFCRAVRRSLCQQNCDQHSDDRNYYMLLTQRESALPRAVSNGLAGVVKCMPSIFMSLLPFRLPLSRELRRKMRFSSRIFAERE